MHRLLAVSLTAVLLASPALAQEKDKGKAVKAPLDESIERAIAYLASSQGNDGSWSARFTRNPAISALAVMAFLSAGHVPGEGKYGDVTKKGIDFVLRQQQPNGLFASEGYQEMYQHGICTLMLAEVVGMTDAKKSDEVRTKLERAVTIILRAQRGAGYHKGGWRYRIVGDDGDISVTGWQLMALRAAKNVGCDVPAERIEWAVEFIKKCHDPYSGGYRYMPGSQLTVACTGTSVLALELCGKEYHRSATSLKAGAFLLTHELGRNSPHYFYGVYYCSQAMFQLGDNYWNTFREKLHEQLLPSQHANGSWTGGGVRGDDAQLGPNYCTAMAVLALAVEYRFLPIYQRDEEPAEKK